jgi:hypothetical protein
MIVRTTALELKEEKGKDQVSTVRIKLSSIIVGGYVNLGLVDEANDLYVVRSLDVLDTLKSGGRDEACAMAGFGAPSDFLTFGVTDGRVRHWRSPQAEVF